ncbi:MAG: hypothetical protein AVDCRST_MAG27-3218, partial [uncultured Craurococcus sp.]
DALHYRGRRPRPPRLPREDQRGRRGARHRDDRPGPAGFRRGWRAALGRRGAPLRPSRQREGERHLGPGPRRGEVERRFRPVRPGQLRRPARRGGCRGRRGGGRGL